MFGYHTHRCPRCRTSWGHTDARQGDRGAHMCPGCGAGPVWLGRAAVPTWAGLGLLAVGLALLAGSTR